MTASRIAKWNGTAWSALGSGIGGSVSALAVSGSALYAGGSFTTAGGVAANYIAKWNGTAWSGLGSGMNNSVTALAVSGSDLYAASRPPDVGGVAARSIAKWNGTEWSALASGGYQILALAVSGSDLYAGGWFTNVGGVAANYIAKWNGTTWSALGSGMDGSVTTLAVSGSDVYAGGTFTTAGGVAANRVAKWNGTAWSALGSGIGSDVAALAVSGSNLYAGGAFTTAGGVAASRIAKWNGTAWSALGSGMDFNVTALAVSGSDLYAGGSFTTAGGVAASGIAKWNGTAWSALGSGVQGLVPEAGTGNTVFYGSVSALAANPSGRLFAGGAFLLAGTTVSPYIAQANIGIEGPEASLEQPAGTPLADSSTRNFGPAAIGSPVDLVFKLTNTGSVPLALTGTPKVVLTGLDAAHFSITAQPVSPVPALTGSTTFTVRFSPTTAGAKTAALSIPNDDTDENPYDVILTGTGLSATTDTDGDGMNDAAEFVLSALGFNWQVAQPALVSTYYTHAATAGLYTPAQIQPLQASSRIAGPNPATGLYSVELSLQKSDALQSWLPFPFLAPQTTVTPAGTVKFDFTLPADKGFIRVQAAP